MRLHTQRKAFSMLTAIFVILIMASVGAMVMSLSGKMVKETTSQFQREQSMLLAKSYTEYAIMAVMANDRSAAGNCLTTINGNFNTYAITVNIAYIGNDGTTPGSDDTLQLCAANAIASIVVTPQSPLNIIIDAYVSYPDDNGQNITYHRRSLQKI